MAEKLTLPVGLESPGERIRWAITNRSGMKLGDAAAQIGVAQPSLSRWMSPKSAPPSDMYLRRIVEITGVPAGWLRYGDEGEPDEETPEDAAYVPGEGVDALPPVGEDEIVQMPQVVKHLKTFDGKPDAAMLKLAAVRVWGEILAMSGGWPDWYVVLRGRVERGEI